MFIFRKNACSCVSRISSLFVKKIHQPLRLTLVYFELLAIASFFSCSFSISCRKLFFRINLCTHHKPYHVKNTHCPMDFDRYIWCFRFLWNFIFFLCFLWTGSEALYVNCHCLNAFWHEPISCQQKLVNYCIHFPYFQYKIWLNLSLSQRSFNSQLI